MLFAYAVSFLFVWIWIFQQTDVALFLVGAEDETLRGICWSWVEL